MRGRHQPSRFGTARGAQRVGLPIVLISLALWLLVGCLYLPSREKVQLTGTKKDFREMPGYDASRDPHVVGPFTRASIEAVLGPPPYGSANGRRVMYVLHVKSGVLIAPLCFTARDRKDDCFGLVLTYDATARLTAWRKLEQSYPLAFDEPYGIDANRKLQDSSEAFLLSQANIKEDPGTTRPWQSRDFEGADALVPNK